MFLLDMAIDVSGTPGDDCYVGLFSINPYQRAELTSKFYAKFSHLRNSRWKGTKLDSKELKQLIQFFDSNQIRCYAVRFPKEAWGYWKKQLLNYGLFHERIQAILYYKLIKFACMRGISKEDQYQTITIDEESNVNVDSLIDTCMRLCKGGRINVRFNKARAKYCEMIKFADYVAAAARKISYSELKQFKSYRLVNEAITYREINKAFRLYKKNNTGNEIDLGNAPHHP